MRDIKPHTFFLNSLCFKGQLLKILWAGQSQKRVYADHHAPQEIRLLREIYDKADFKVLR
jgi:hypothetical protein